jgi:hypothetical protein
MVNKKGQLGDLQGIILTLVIVGLLLGVAFLVLGELRTNLTTTTNTVSNETVTPTDLGVYLDYNSTTAGVNCYNTVAIVSVCNESGPCGPTTLLSSGNYTVNTYTGLFKNITVGNDDYNRNWIVTYTYKSGDEACQGVAETITATKQIPVFLPILVIVMVVGILLVINFVVVGVI